MSAPRTERAGLYYPKLPNTWWLKNPRYFRFMIREVTSVFIAIFLAVLLVELYQLSRGPEAYTAFVERLRRRAGSSFISSRSVSPSITP